MRVLTWSLRLFIFLFLVAFALKNTAPVDVRFLLDASWRAPLVIVALAFFAAGALLGAVALLGVIFRQRREIARLRRASGAPPSVAEGEPLPVVPPRVD